MPAVLTYAVIAIFVAICVTLIFGYSRLMRLQHEVRRAERAVAELGSAERDLALVEARRRYNGAIASFPTNMVAVLTGFRRQR